MTDAEKAFRLEVCTCVQRVGLDQFQTAPSSVDFSDYGLRLEDVLVATDPGGADRNFGAVLMPPSGAGMIPIHGTQTKEEWARVDAWAVPIEMVAGGGPVMVHRGMYELYSTLRLLSGRPLLATLLALGIETLGGHSLGGPLATGLSAQLKAINLICFASSKPGDRRFSDWVQRSVQNIWLMANPNDEVPRLPFTGPAPIDFQHVVPLEYLGPGPIPSDWENSHQLDSYRILLEAA